MQLHVPTWSWTAPDDPAERIDRTLIDRGHRLIAGMNVSRRFDRIDAVLLVAVGHGKYLRVKHTEGQSRPIPQALGTAFRELVHQRQPTIADVKQLTGDLAIIQAGLFEQVKCRAGKYVDRILAIAVADPGLWWNDFDGSTQYAGLCDPGRLSQLTGVTVIDDFPAADVASGGTGRCLDALPQWLLRADRVNGIAAAHRLVVQFASDATGYWLPASDGLDADVPGIRTTARTPGVDFLDGILGLFEGEMVPQSASAENASSRIFPGPLPTHDGNVGPARDANSRGEHSQLEKLYAQGSRSDELIEAWRKQWERFLERDGAEPIDGANDPGKTPLKASPDEVHRTAIDRLISVTQEEPFARLPAADVLRSAIVWLTELVVDSVSPVQARVDEVWFAADTPLNHCLINQFLQASGLPDSRVHAIASTNEPNSPRGESQSSERFEASGTGGPPHCQTTGSITAAIMGFLHIDQMPASVPLLTGAREHRTLGRLTPGKPSNWRQLLREMADFHPPAMKLRDAV